MLVVLLRDVMCPVVLWCLLLSYMTDFVIVVLTHFVLIFLLFYKATGKAQEVKVKGLINIWSLDADEKNCQVC